MNELERIVAATRQELRERQRAVPLAELESETARYSPRGSRFHAALKGPGISLIAEHKRRSPSAGSIRDGVPLQAVVEAYERGGAAALSILTNGPSFGGSLDDLRAARAVTELSLLRKDFIVEPYQLLEAASSGADAILLIVAALGDAELSALHERALELGLAALVEVHDRGELERALELGAAVIGINNRDLRTLMVDTRTTFKLRPLIPESIVVVAESGFARREQLDELAAAEIDAVLVGEALMRSEDIEAACRELTRADPAEL